MIKITPQVNNKIDLELELDLQQAHQAKLRKMTRKVTQWRFS
jgi:hypothetical protein